MLSRLSLLSRASDLAVLQATLVARALEARWPGLEISIVKRTALGDRDERADLRTLPDKGVFTADLSRALVRGEADAAVHSWKDLPVADSSDTMIAATLDRADPRDVLLVRREAVLARPASLTVLSSSPRRAWQLETSLPRWLPWTLSTVLARPVRGNVPTRLDKLTAGAGDALVVAKAALDRLLSDAAPREVRARVRRALDRCRWMVLPLRDHPTAPAQGALAVEVARDRPDAADLVRAVSHEPTWSAVGREREILRSFGGGCHDAIGATVLERDYGRVTSVRARLPGGTDVTTWRLESSFDPPPRTSERALWPRPDERDRATRRSIDVPPPPGDVALWIARADALPDRWTIGDDRIVWAAGPRTWDRLARRGIWVHGCAEGLGDHEPIDVDALAGRRLDWRRITHTASGDPGALGTYAVQHAWPGDLGSRTHFFWTSGSAFLEAIAETPAILDGWHASGPGRTWRVIRGRLDSPARASVWLDYDQWHKTVTS